MEKLRLFQLRALEISLGTQPNISMKSSIVKLRIKSTSLDHPPLTRTISLQVPEVAKLLKPIQNLLLSQSLQENESHQIQQKK